MNYHSMKTSAEAKFAMDIGKLRIDKNKKAQSTQGAKKRLKKQSLTFMNNDIGAKGLTCTGETGVVAMTATVGSPEEALWTPGDTPAHHQQSALFTGGALVCPRAHTAGTAGGTGQTLVHHAVHPETEQKGSETSENREIPVQSPVRSETGRDELKHREQGRPGASPSGPWGSRALSGSPNTLFGTHRFSHILTLALWCRPSQTSHWLLDTPRPQSLALTLTFWRRCYCGRHKPIRSKNRGEI